MSHGVQYFVWRGGRPRWEPGPSVRQRGFRGRDLKHPDGTWLPLAAALDEAKNLNVQAGISEGRTRRSGTKKNVDDHVQGYVYFLRSGEQIKIGFSAGPYSRISKLMTGLAYGVSSLGAVAGSKLDERQLHNEFADLRIHGEWFYAKWKLRLFMANSLAAGRLVWGKTGRTL